MGKSSTRFALGLLLAGTTSGLLLAGGACGGGAADLVGGEGSYSETAQDNYESGMKALASEDFDGATRYFRYVKAKFPFSKYAVLADLRVADAEFVHQDYIEAIDSYTQFAKFHPTQEYVTNGYVAYKIGEGFYKQIPDDWWLVPPSYEKDETAALDSDRQLQAFLDKYPESDYVSQARDLLSKTHELLAAHEMYVATFYSKRGQFRGAAFRLETLLARYPETSLAPTAYLQLGQAYLQLGEPWNARHAFQTLVEKHPGDATAVQAKSDLGDLDRQYGAGGPAAPANPTLPPLQPSSRPTYDNPEPQTPPGQ